jgi:hypothetical protein
MFFSFVTFLYKQAEKHDFCVGLLPSINREESPSIMNFIGNMHPKSHSSLRYTCYVSVE